ncbi:annexin B9 isoform X1 [Microplitis demolitor]|nr:annexin B9 isoform X1 [Microplitis demolitor]
MSYGYQGPPMPFPGQKPTSFEAHPGASSAPGAQPYPQNNYGFNPVPAPFNMPQPFASPYPSNPYPQTNPSMPYPNQSDFSSPYPSMPPNAAYSYPMNPGQAPPQNPTQFCPDKNPGFPAQPYAPQSYHGMTYPSQPAMNPGMGHPSPLSMTYPSQPAMNPGMGMNRNYPGNASSHTNAYPGSYPGGQGAGGYQFAPSMATMSSYHSSASAPKMSPVNPKPSPTVVPFPAFNPREDAEVLRKAMKGFGTDEKAIINVLANRTNLQRQEIAFQFKTLYGKDLIKDLKSELTGNFENLVVAMMTPIPNYYATELHEAMSGIGTDECVLIEVMCTMSNQEIHMIRQAYESIYGRSLEDDLREDTSGCFKRLMVSLCCGHRDESFEVNQSAAMEDARRLLQAGELRFGTDESTFNAVLVQRSIPQLKQIFAEYQNITGNSIEDAIKNEFSGDIEKGLRAIVQCVNHRAGFFAKQLYKSMKGMGTDDRRLIRLVVTRSEIDMGEIKQAYIQQYGKSLEDAISGDCSGHYKKCLLALIA